MNKFIYPESKEDKKAEEKIHEIDRRLADNPEVRLRFFQALSKMMQWRGWGRPTKTKKKVYVDKNGLIVPVDIEVTKYSDHDSFNEAIWKMIKTLEEVADFEEYT